MAAPARTVRPVLLPSLIGAVAVLAGLFVIGAGDEAYTPLRYVISLLALIVAVMAVQSRRWFWALPLVAVAVLWNPVFPILVTGTIWAGAHILAAAVFFATGLLLRVPEDTRR